jgi:hypothetical protein
MKRGLTRIRINPCFIRVFPWLRPLLSEIRLCAAAPLCLGVKKLARRVANPALFAITTCLFFLFTLPAYAVTPEGPEVKQMVERALKWLENQSDDRLGGKCLIGLALYKGGRKPDHPKLVEVLQACDTSMNAQIGDIDNYSVGLALIFLLESNPDKNRSLAQRYVQEVLRRQQATGGWGYPGNPLGDTSQTQYPTLGLWLAYNQGMNVPTTAIEKICGWLLRTQDRSGAWGYQGQDPGKYERINQSEIRPSLVAAGLGSVYICSSILSLTDSKPQDEPDGQPSALKPVGESAQKKKKGTSRSIEAKIVRNALSDGNAWLYRNYTLESEPYTHYYLYALERYHSFRELAEQKTDPNPRWYNDVYEKLKKTQDANGSWNGTDGAAVTTSFCVLTLMRSAKKTIASAVASKLGEGVLLGGMGLPKNVADLQERDGRLVESQLTGTVDELMTIIEKGSKPELQILAESPIRWKLDDDVTRRSGEIVRLRAVVSGGEYEARLVAVKALSRARDLDNVPLLIYALTDPDMRIVREADKGLRFISRKFEGVGLPEEPQPGNVKSAIEAWKTWYRSIRPRAEFLD